VSRKDDFWHENGSTANENFFPYAGTFIKAATLVRGCGFSNNGDGVR
jgi:hypothetical protein